MATGAAAPVEAKGETVLVTGASGFIGSWLVRLLLARGYSVHAAVLNPDDKAETDHLLAHAAVAGDEARVRFFRCDLLDEAAMLAAARGCSGVFHLASPCTVDQVIDPQKELVVPAVEGTLNVLRAAKEAGGVRRVVVTSSVSALVPCPGWPAGEVLDERCWTDIDYCDKNGSPVQGAPQMATGAAAGEAKGETVLVTGASGVIGSCLVRLLLARGYSIHAAVLNPDDKAETDHLLALAAAAGDEGRVRFFRCDLLDGDAMLAAARGCSGVFHLASPCTVDQVLDPQKELVVPAVEGTLNVLRAAKESGGVRRVVVTSSVSALVPCPGWPAGEVLDERCWTDIDYCHKNGVWYPASKALAEKAAWKFAEENGLDVVAVNPGTVLGEMIPPKINASMAMFLRLLEGCTEEYADFFIGPVHVEDVALAHILLYENPSASGRHLCVEPICHWSDFAAKVAELYPDYKVPKFPEDTQPGLVRAEGVPKKLMALGLHFSPVEKIIRDAVESLRSRGCIA